MPAKALVAASVNSRMSGLVTSSGGGSMVRTMTEASGWAAMRRAITWIADWRLDLFEPRSNPMQIGKRSWLLDFAIWASFFYLNQSQGALVKVDILKRLPDKIYQEVAAVNRGESRCD